MLRQINERNIADVRNTTTRPQPGLFQVEKDDPEDVDMTISGFDREDLVDVGSRRTFLRPGDLVELLYDICWLSASEKKG